MEITIPVLVGTMIILPATTARLAATLPDSAAEYLVSNEGEEVDGPTVSSAVASVT
jgi:hypothetical protein